MQSAIVAKAVAIANDNEETAPLQRKRHYRFGLFGTIMTLIALFCWWPTISDKLDEPIVRRRFMVAVEGPNYGLQQDLVEKVLVRGAAAARTSSTVTFTGKSP
mmetsp:Transcript_15299/g.19958  ORF Transcript_15299/g.19958 Transcript_15299/m.19958 type:complete len:103 (-) Transcript_15299:282-590(-)|eukprot:CAMPEP_0198150212 /NCGR_PEP_ID=MMETSP1443-20131203/49966_1 /TAXON_ID=186043 /ORGANISM="Entomoneis sp., Strain CCMP2396" /LENGTH=102 /DNA_ID=CAMNT_0043815461 /DNA_START=79 /DNA_END=387 /DNA_ORIENTATION=+